MKKKVLLFFVFGIILSLSMSSSFVFAEGTIKISSYENTINSLDSIIIIGTITGGSTHNPVQLTVLDPNGNVLYKPSVTFDGDGNFNKVIHSPVSGFIPGTYTVIASQNEITQTAELQFTVIESPFKQREDTQRSDILDEAPSSNIVDEVQRPFSIYADAIVGSSVINVSGMTQSTYGDVTVKVTSPNGNLISIDQVTPSSRGEFSIEIITGGPLWEQDGQYTVTAFQGSASELNDSVQVEIKDGVVIPEFGSLATIILIIAMISIIALTAKSRRMNIIRI